MQVQSMHFHARAAKGMADERFQGTMRKVGRNFVHARARVAASFGDFEGLRTAGAAIRDRSLADLDVWLEKFEQNATRRGGKVQWAETSEDVCAQVIEICRRHGLKKAVKSKSMLSEEAGLNQALEAAGVQPVETDLGEYILQINDNEAPSHIIAPVIHKSQEEVSELFERVHGTPRQTDVNKMTREARDILRPHFLSADLGISGGNFLVAETGSVAIVTNEGNGRMVTTLPRVHIVITGIEKVVPTLEDLSVLMRLLPRSATGQTISNYFSVLTGPKGSADQDGPEHLYFILVDSGRTKLLGGEMQEMLRCIRCGACMNHCPVYQTVGGHAYGWVYPGPMGSVLTPTYIGIENALDLPQAATMCGACHVACPVKIPLPDLLRKLREKQVDLQLRPWYERAGFRVWSWLALHPRLYALATRIGARAAHGVANRKGMISKLPLLGGWTDGRDLPAPAGRTFRDLYAERSHR